MKRLMFVTTLLFFMLAGYGQVSGLDAAGTGIRGKNKVGSDIPDGENPLSGRIILKLKTGIWNFQL